MSYLRKHPAPLVALLGAVLAAQSIAWEYARVAPDYRFIVSPWSVRGYDSTQGKVILAIAIGIAALVVIAWWDVVSERGVPQLAVGAAFMGAAIAIGAIAGSNYEITLGPTAAIFVALAAGYITTALIKPLLPKSIDPGARNAVAYGGPLLITLVFYLAVLGPFIVDEAINYPVWVLIAIVGTPLVLLAIVGDPRDLATNRLLILAVLAGWATTMLSAGAIRTVLVELQQEAGAAAQYKDLQITSGMILAFVGMGLSFLGGVGMWAQRRDQLIALRRAAEQRAAAEKSAAEIADALEMLDPEYR